MAIQTTLTDQIDAIKNSELSYRTLHDYIVIHDVSSDANIKVPYASIMHKYKDYLSHIIMEVPMEEYDEKRYRFNPKLLSYECYGTTEFWSELLDLNNFTSITEFKPLKVIRVYAPDKLKELLNEILIIDDDL